MYYLSDQSSDINFGEVDKVKNSIRKLNEKKRKKIEEEKQEAKEEELDQHDKNLRLVKEEVASEIHDDVQVLQIKKEDQNPTHAEPQSIQELPKSIEKIQQSLEVPVILEQKFENNDNS